MEATVSHSTTIVVRELSDSTFLTGLGLDGLRPIATVVSDEGSDGPN